jgi:hypothetical protein
MVNIALAFAFALSSLLSPGRRILQLAIDGPVFQSLPPYQGHLLLAFANYWVPAVLAYLILRFLRAESWLRPRPAIHVLLGLANVLLILYVATRTFASTIQGGGASFVVMSFAPFVILPAWIMLGTGLIWLAVRSVRGRAEQPQIVTRPSGIGTAFGIAAAFGIPAAAVAWTLFLSDSAPFRLAKEAEELFRERCVAAGEKIFETPADVQSVYLDRDGGQYFENIVNGVYGGYGGGILGEPLVNSGFLLYFEKQNDRQRVDGSTAKYWKHGLKDWKGEPEEELTSEFGVFQKSLVSDDVEKRLGVHGTEVTIKNLRDEHIVASLVFYTSSRHRIICGHTGNGHFGVSDFVRKSLNLTRQFPSAFPQNGAAKK